MERKARGLQGLAQRRIFLTLLGNEGSMLYNMGGADAEEYGPSARLMIWDRRDGLIQAEGGRMQGFTELPFFSRLALTDLVHPLLISFPRET